MHWANLAEWLPLHTELRQRSACMSLKHAHAGSATVMGDTCGDVEIIYRQHNVSRSLPSLNPGDSNAEYSGNSRRIGVADECMLQAVLCCVYLQKNWDVRRDSSRAQDHPAVCSGERALSYGRRCAYRLVRRAARNGARDVMRL